MKENNKYKKEYPQNILGKILNGDEIYKDNDKVDIMDQLNIKKLRPFLYTIDYTDLDYSYGEMYMEKFGKNIPSACSSVRKGNFYGRNFDWLYDNTPTFIIRTLGCGSRHSTLCVVSDFKTIPNDFVESGKYTEIYKALPFIANDGINDAGVVCNINVVPQGDKGYTSGTNPGKIRMCQDMMIRYILDYADCAHDAIYLLMDRDIFGCYAGDLEIEVHLMVADKDTTYIIEFVDNKMHIMSDKDTRYDSIPGDTPIMTNFYLTGWDGNTPFITGFDEDEEIDPSTTTLTPHAEGLERYMILKNGYNNVESAEDMIDLMKQVYFTKGYSTDDMWYSEFVGKTATFGDLTIYLPKSEFAGIKEYVLNAFAHRDQRLGDTWASLHTSVFDIENRKLYLTHEELDGTFEFSL